MTIINKKNCYERDKYCGIVKLKVSGWTFQKRVATGCFALKILCQILVHIESLDQLLLIKNLFYSKHVLFWFLQQRPAHFLHQIVLLAAALSWSWSCKIDQRFGKMSVLGMFQYKCKVGNWTATMDRVDSFNCSIHPLCCGKSRQSSKSWKKLPIYKC